MGPRSARAASTTEGSIGRAGRFGLATLVAGIVTVVVSAGVSGALVHPHWETGLVTTLKNAADSTTVEDGSTVAFGTRVYDTAKLSYNEPEVPTGTVSYSFFTNSSCTAPASSQQTVTLNADGTVPNTDATDPLGAGTYGFSATYSGDFEYPGSTSSCEPFTVGPGSDTTTTTILDTTTTTIPDTTTSTSPPATTTTEQSTTTTQEDTTTVASTAPPGTSIPPTTVPDTTSTVASTSTSVTTTSTQPGSTSTTTPGSTSTSSLPGGTSTTGASSTSTSRPSPAGGGTTTSTAAGGGGTQGGSGTSPVTAPASALAFTGAGLIVEIAAGFGALLVLVGLWLLSFAGLPRRFALRLLGVRSSRR